MIKKLEIKAISCLILLLSSINGFAYDFEVDGFYYNKLSSNEVEVTCMLTQNAGYSGEIVIPQRVKYNGVEYAVVAISSSAFSGSKITKLTIPNSIKSIGNYAFSGCTGIKGILNIPNSVESIGDHAFSGCTGLTGPLSIPNSVKEIGSAAFYNCSGFTGTLTISNSIIKIEDSTFGECSGLSGTLSIPASVKTIGSYAFEGCSGFTGSLVIPNSVTSIGEKSFRGCNGLTGSLTIGNSVTYIASCAFWKCKFSGSLTIPNSVQTIENQAFADCENFDGELIIGTSMSHIGSNAFSNCSGFTTLTLLPKYMRGIYSHAFYRCSNLSQVNSNLLEPVEIHDVFEGISSDAILKIPKGTRYSYWNFGWKRFFKSIIEEGVSYYTVSISTSGNGFIQNGTNTFRNETCTFEVSEGESVTVSFSPDSGYRIASVKVNNTDVTSSVSNNKYTISNISANTTLAVTFEAIPPTTYALSITASGNGSATYSSTTARNQTRSFTVNEGTSATVTFSPDSGYRIASVKVNNTDVTSSVSNNSYTISNISANTTLSVTFEAIPPTTYTLSITASGNGSATYSSTTARNQTRTFTVNEGTSATVTFSPDSGYQIASVLVNNSNVTSSVSNNKYTISNIKANTTVKVTFEAITYTLSITSTGNGYAAYNSTSVRNQTRSFNVNEGNSATVTFNPDNGNSISSVKVDGKDVTSQIASNRYVINSMSANTTVAVTFVEDVNALTVNGINYTVVSQANKTVKVTGGDYGQVLTVPATVTSNGATWTITGIEDNALKDNKELAAIVWNPTAAFTATVSNPNLLLYVKGSQYAPSAIKNVVVNGTASNITLVDAASGNSFYCPQRFTAQKISYTHNYNMTTGVGESKGWETIALPFDVRKISHSTKDIITPFANWNHQSSVKPFWLYELAGTGFVEASEIKAYKPYIISMPNNPKYDNPWLLKGSVTFESTSVIIEVTEDLKTATYSDRTFVPNFSDKAANEGLYALNVINDYVTNNSGMTEGSKFVLNMRQIHPFEAYMTTTSNASQMFGIFEDMTTSIRTVDNEEWTISNDVYDLQGRKVTGPKKGVYIKNGKKLIIK